jgi:hypothetical protein
MANMVTPMKKETSNGASLDVQKGIENHRKAAKHLEEAARHHNDAAKHHEAGNHDKACASTVKAHGHSCLAAEHQREDIKQHALNPQA